MLVGEGGGGRGEPWFTSNARFLDLKLNLLGWAGVTCQQSCLLVMRGDSYL